jgi:hypothetical protein
MQTPRRVPRSAAGSPAGPTNNHDRLRRKLELFKVEITEAIRRSCYDKGAWTPSLNQTLRGPTVSTDFQQIVIDTIEKRTSAGGQKAAE